jgi:hypothetical protein
LSQKDDREREITDIRELLIQALQADGWTIAVEPSRFPDTFDVRLDHPLSAQVNYSLTYGRGERNVRMLEAFLNSAEVSALSNAPEEREHSQLIRGIRAAGAVGDWPSNVIPELAPVLRNHGIITEVEMDWLIDAGALRPTSG